MPSATPRSQRPSARSRTPPLPPYEPPLAPLHATGHAKLITLLKSQSLRQLKTHLQHAEEKLTDSAGEINERLTDTQVRYQKQKQKRRQRAHQHDQDGDTELGEVDEHADKNEDEEHTRLTQLQEQVGSMTTQLDEAMRRTIDAEARVDELSTVMSKFEAEAEQASTRAQSGRRRRTLRTRDRPDDDDDDEDADYEATPDADDEDPPSRVLDESLQTGQDRWADMSLTERYATNNAYVGFYRMIHEAQHPGDDIPPLPHASTWFSHLEDTTATRRSSDNTQSGRPAGRTRQQQQQQRERSVSSAGSDDIAIERERISLKCPLTLLPFRDPVTSTKCPHSFEREAIESMITQSSTTVAAPPGARTKRMRSVKCPVCSEVLTAGDLRSDAVLLRRVRRAEAAERRDAEDDELDAEGERRQERRRSKTERSGITLASDDDDRMDVDSDEAGPAEGRRVPDAVRIKKEFMSSAPRDDSE